jgi:hypothetical protein
MNVGALQRETPARRAAARRGPVRRWLDELWDAAGQSSALRGEEPRTPPEGDLLPPAEDAGRGLAFVGGWAQSRRDGRRLRWLAPWLQRALAEGWNLTRVGVTAQLRFHYRRPRYLALLLGAVAVGEAATRLEPLSWPFVGALAGVGLGCWYVNCWR